MFASIARGESPALSSQIISLFTRLMVSEFTKLKGRQSGNLTKIRCQFPEEVLKVTIRSKQ